MGHPRTRELIDGGPVIVELNGPGQVSRLGGVEPLGRGRKDLLQERNFCIIELNGAGSEPTHIYDPAHSIFFAWKEIIRHWRLLYEVSAANVEHKNIPLMNTRDGLRLIANHARHLKLIQPL